MPSTATQVNGSGEAKCGAYSLQLNQVVIAPR